MSERVLVAAPYPTMGGAEAAATFALVKELVADGDDVFVVSPRPSAAHAHADPGSPRGAARLASLVAGRTRLVVRLDAGALAVSSESPRLLPGRVALAAAIRRVPRADVILDRVPSTVAPRWVSLVLAPAASVTVASAGERDAVVAAGVSATKVTVDPDILPPSPDRILEAIARPSAQAGPADAGLSASAIEELMRRRAAEMQSPIEAGFGPGRVGVASKPLRAIPPLERPRIRSNNPAYASVKRVQLKLLAWMFDWVIQHVNHLHQATIEAIELAEGERAAQADSSS